MNLHDFEEYIDDIILKRGKDYFRDDHVESIKEVSENQFVIDVIGSDYYTVEVLVDDSGDITDTYCDCPFDWGDYCKHQVAAFLALRSKLGKKIRNTSNKKSSNSHQKVDIEAILTSLSKEELVKILLQLSKEYPVIEKKLLFEYVPVEYEITQSKKLIREYINEHKYRGFIDWNKTYDALQGAHMTLEKAKRKLEQGEIESTVQLSITVLSIVVDMLEYCDDSSGYVGNVIESSLDMIKEATTSNLDVLNQIQKEKLFNVILKEAIHSRYEGWIDFRIDLLEACIPFLSTKQLRKKFEKEIKKLESQASDSRLSQYELQKLKMLQLSIIEQNDEPDKVEQFIQEHIHYSDVRKIAINRLLEKKEYAEVVKLCLEGEKLDESYPGLVTTWKQYRYKAYERLNDLESQRDLALQLLFENHFEYYSKLKSLYPLSEWKEILQGIVNYFENKSYQSSVYLKILIEEDLKERLIQYCNKNLYSIEHLYPYLIEDYYEEVCYLYEKYIESEASMSSNRKQYKGVCKLIKSYKKVFGDSNAKRLINNLRAEYERRPAFLDELSKIR